MKKVICLLLGLIIIVSFTSCSKNGIGASDGANNESATTTVSSNKELSDEKLAEIVAKSLNVPDKVSACYVVSEMYYWDAADRHYKNIIFTENEKMVAAADVDPYSGELLKNIQKYDSSY